MKKIIPKFNDFEYPQVGQIPPFALKCPFCGEACLHQIKTEVFERSNDEPMLRKTTVTRRVTATEVVPSADSGNPSPRRQGLRIQLECESCHSNKPIRDKLYLNILQHKGTTYLEFSTRDKGECMGVTYED